jgi:exodeoxyribonuclease VII large subunit
MIDAAEPRTFTVSEITGLIKDTLEYGFPDVTVQGEISNFRPSTAGHLYFSLKDNDAIISAVMFRNRHDTLRFQPADGMLVRARGSVSVYPKRGNYQLICEDIRRTGEGDILAMIEERKRKLAAEGLFSEERKKPLPLYPSRIAVVTSPTGAAIRDILRILKRRNAGIDVVVLPTLVQGEDADAGIARQIEIANMYSLGDVIIVSRGGGSLEDLLPFSSEIVVRAISASRLPVISAVGHETDFSLSDLAADVRAPTPSAAAEIVAASRAELLHRVELISSTVAGVISRKLEKVGLLLSQFRSENLERSFRVFMGPLSMRLDDAGQALRESFADGLKDMRHRLELASSNLSSCSPFGILERGYAIVSLDGTGKPLFSNTDARAGDMVRVRLARGGLKAEVKETYAGEKL